MCAWCKTDISHRRHAKYCGKACKQRDYRARAREKSPQAVLECLMANAMAMVGVKLSPEETARLNMVKEAKNARLT